MRIGLFEINKIYGGVCETLETFEQTYILFKNLKTEGQNLRRY